MWKQIKDAKAIASETIIEKSQSGVDAFRRFRNSIILFSYIFIKLLLKIRYFIKLPRLNPAYKLRGQFDNLQ